VGDERGAEREAEDALGTDDEREEAEAEEDGVVVESRFTIDADAMDWLERLTTDAPVLCLGLLDFVDGSRNQEARMSREVFNKRLSWCLNRVEGRTIKAQLVEMLYTRAIQDRQMMSAYDAFKNALQSNRFSESYQFIQGELERLAKVSASFKRPKGVMVPRILSQWESVWIGSLHELADTIRAQLEAAEKSLVELQKFLHLGRTEIESYLLWSTHLSIAEAIKGMKPRISAYKLLVAYAHASELIPYRRSADDRVSVIAMKMRVSRVKRSPTKIGMLSVIVAQMIKTIPSVSITT
jgi:hypothetical protein